MKKMEARVGIEPTIKDLQSSALPLGDRAILKMDLGKKKQDTHKIKCILPTNTDFSI